MNGWNNFKFGILEYIDLHPGADTKINKEIILKREQFYLDLFLPSLNVNKIAGSMLGYKHSEENLLKISQVQRGRKISSPMRNKNNNPMSLETINKIRQRVKGVIIKVFDENNNLVQEFPTISETAKFYGVSRVTISRYVESGRLWDNKFLFKLELKPQEPKALKVNEPLPLNESQINQYGKLVEVFDKDNKLVYRFKSIRNAASFLNTSHSTLSHYIKDGKLWNNLYTFKINLYVPVPPIIPFPLSSNLSKVQESPSTNYDSSAKSAKGFLIEVYNAEMKLLYRFNSIRNAAKMLGIDRSTIKQYADSGKLCKSLYFFKKAATQLPIISYFLTSRIFSSI